MLLRTKLLLIFFFFIMGCANSSKPLIGDTAKPTQVVSVGMSKAEFLKLKGEPERVEASGRSQTFFFLEQKHLFDPAKLFYYRFVGDQLFEYGRAVNPNQIDIVFH